MTIGTNLESTKNNQSEHDEIKNSVVFSIEEKIRNEVELILSDMGGFSDKEWDLFYWLDAPNLELARIWCWQKLRTSYNADTVIKLYNFIQESWEDELSLWPVAFRYCSTIEEIISQHELTKTLLGNNLSSYVKWEKIIINKIDDYEIKIHKHDCEFGSGLICLSLFRDNRHIYQIWFYPSSPFRIYEIKWWKPSSDNSINKKRKSDLHRFNDKYDFSPASFLVTECLKIAKKMDLEVNLITQASLWRNYDLVRNPEKREQANKVYIKVKQELGLKYTDQVEAIIEISEWLKSIFLELEKEENTYDDKNKIIENHTRCIEYITTQEKKYKNIFKENDLIIKLLFSDFSNDYFIDINNLFNINLENNDNISWGTLINSIRNWARINYNISDIKIDNIDSFDIPLFIEIDKKTIIELIKKS